MPPTGGLCNSLVYLFNRCLRFCRLIYVVDHLKSAFKLMSVAMMHFTLNRLMKSYSALLLFTMFELFCITITKGTICGSDGFVCEIIVTALQTNYVSPDKFTSTPQQGHYYVKYMDTRDFISAVSECNLHKRMRCALIHRYSYAATSLIHNGMLARVFDADDRNHITPLLTSTDTWIGMFYECFMYASAIRCTNSGCADEVHREGGLAP